jgi:hypothetical protein
VAAARWMRRWRQRNIVTLVAACRQCGSGDRRQRDSETPRCLGGGAAAAAASAAVAAARLRDSVTAAAAWGRRGGGSAAAAHSATAACDGRGEGKGDQCCDGDGDALAGNVADMSRHVGNDTTCRSNFGQMGPCCRHKIEDVVAVCVGLSRHLPDFRNSYVEIYSMVWEYIRTDTQRSFLSCSGFVMFWRCDNAHPHNTNKNREPHNSHNE